MRGEHFEEATYLGNFEKIGENIFFGICKFKESIIVQAEHFGKRTFWWEHLFREEYLFLGGALLGEHFFKMVNRILF